MQRMIEIDAEIDASGEIHAKLAGTYRPGPVHLTVFLDPDQPVSARQSRHQPLPCPSAQDAKRHADDHEQLLLSEEPHPEDFAGIWSDFADQEFREFMDDIGDRRREAFAGRSSR